MKSRIIKSNARNGFTQMINQSGTLIFMFACFTVGFLAGVLTLKFKGISSGFFKNEFADLCTQLKGGFLSVLFSSVMRLLPFAAGIFISGTCMAGSVLVPVILLLSGAYYGLLSAYSYAVYSLSGIVFNALILLPFGVISAMAMILSSREAFGFSFAIARLAFPTKKSRDFDRDFKLYCMRHIFLVGIFLCAVLIQTVMAVAFYKYFAFV